MFVPSGETEEIAIECFEEGEIMIDDLEQAVQDIQEGTEESVKEGIELIGQAIKAAAEMLSHCFHTSLHGRMPRVV